MGNEKVDNFDDPMLKYCTTWYKGAPTVFRLHPPWNGGKGDFFIFLLFLPDEDLLFLFIFWSPPPFPSSSSSISSSENRNWKKQFQNSYIILFYLQSNRRISTHFWQSLTYERLTPNFSVNIEMSLHAWKNESTQTTSECFVKSSGSAIERKGKVVSPLLGDAFTYSFNRPA